MSDKEKAEKENEQFSSSILYVATAVYVGLCAMVFGALYAKLPSFGEAFLALMKDYGTILAGIPVLVAVVVAKQQLDAGRKQHVAAVKRSLHKEIDAINAIKMYAGNIINYKDKWFYKTTLASDHPIFPATSFAPWIIKNWPDALPAYLLDDVERLEFACAKVFQDSPHREDFDSAVAFPIALAHTLIKNADEERERLSEYWS